MSMPKVSILYTNGALGTALNFAEGVCGAIMTGVATANMPLGTPKSVYSFSDVKDLLITSAGNPAAYKALKEFYDMAGDGAALHFMMVANTMTQQQMWDNTSSTGIKAVLDYAQGAVRVAFSVYNPSSAGAITNALETDVYNAITNAQVTATAYATANMPFRALIDGRGFTGVAASLTDLTSLTANRVSVVIGSTTNDSKSSVGLCAGSFAAIPVQRKISRVKNGALPIAIASGYVGAQSVDTCTYLDTIHDKGYIILRKFAPGKSGYYWNGDHTCCANTDDYNSFARGRVIDKAAIIAYTTFIDEVDDEIAVDDQNKILPGVVKYLQDKIENQIRLTMSGQISKVSAYIDPAQDILSTSKTTVVLKITPVGYNSNIDVKLGF